MLGALGQHRLGSDLDLLMIEPEISDEIRLPSRRGREQLRALDVGRLGGRAGHLGADEMREVDEALSLVLALR